MSSYTNILIQENTHIDSNEYFDLRKSYLASEPFQAQNRSNRTQCICIKINTAVTSRIKVC